MNWSKKFRKEASFLVPWMLVAAFAGTLSVGCTGGRAPGWRETPEGDGPQVVWDLNDKPLPELPLPNDVATWPDPNSPTGRRVNVSMVAPTHFETLTRTNFDDLDGWGAYQALTVAFDKHIDTKDFADRQGRTSDVWSKGRWGEHGVYLINLKTGVPMPLDVNHGNYPFVLDHTDQYVVNDPHADGSNLFFETHLEDKNGNGKLDPGEDIDFDGVLDEPNTFDGTLDAGPLADVDDMTWFYDREAKSLVLKPILPLDGATEYAVVVTDRVHGLDGKPVRSPFDHVHHIAQFESLAGLPNHFKEHSEYYGDLSTRGWDGVAFAWTFTTQTIGKTLDTIREGFYGQGPMAYLAKDYPNDYALLTATDSGPDVADGCQQNPDNVYIADGELFQKVMIDVFKEFRGEFADGENQEGLKTLVASFGNIDHVVAGVIENPYFIGDPKELDIEKVFRLNPETGEADIHREGLSFLMFVPKETETQKQPFDVQFFMHGYTGAATSFLPFAGWAAQHGTAMIAINAPEHGTALTELEEAIVREFFSRQCMRTFGDALVDGRAKDWDGDGKPNTGQNYWSAYTFHTRDVVRQTVSDHLRLTALFRSFDGRKARPASFTTSMRGLKADYDAKIHGPEGDIAGDFDGNGVPDLGGPDVKYLMGGGSLGGIISDVMTGVEPAIETAAPMVGGGGYIDISSRSVNTGVKGAMHSRLLGPFIVGVPFGGGRNPQSGTAQNRVCGENEVALDLFVSKGNRSKTIEFACVPLSLANGKSVIWVRNLTTGELFCGGELHQEAGRYHVPFASDAGDKLQIELYADAIENAVFGDDACGFTDSREPTRVINTWEVGNGEDEEPNKCKGCAKFWTTTWQIGDALVSPASGLAKRRQSPGLRRLMMLAQMALDDADPIHYARRYFLEPQGTHDFEPRERPVLVVNTIGDLNVSIAAGNAFARAAGILPFMPADAPDEFKDWRAPSWFQTTYPGYKTPNDLLIAHHVFEGVDRLNRHPVDGADHFLFDVDNTSDGLLAYRPDGRKQSSAPDAVKPGTLDKPLRWIRQPRRSTGSDEDTLWSYEDGKPIAGLLNHYVRPIGDHGLDEAIHPVTDPFDGSQYLINLLFRYGATYGVDIPYITDPEGHKCMSTSSCSYIRQADPVDID